MAQKTRQKKQGRKKRAVAVVQKEASKPKGDGTGSGSQINGGEKCEHQLLDPLVKALKRCLIKLAGEGGTVDQARKNANQVLNRDLKNCTQHTRTAALGKTQVKALAIYFDELRQKVNERKLIQNEYDELERLRDGQLATKDDAIAEYLEHIDERIRAVNSDAIRKRRALEAKAGCLEFEGRWLEAVSVLRQIITIEEDQILDPVEGARTRTRTAQAYIQDSQMTSWQEAKKLLLEGLERIKNVTTVLRTRLELLLTLAHSHLWLEESQACLDRLTECKPLLHKLRGQQARASEEGSAEKNRGDHDRHVSSDKSSAANSYITLGADYDVRMGAVLKRRNEKIADAHSHLVRGALVRAEIEDVFGTAHAVRHLGDLYAERNPRWVERREALKRSLWFYLAAWDIFKENRNEKQVARTHMNCGEVLKMLLEESPHLNANQQRNELATFISGIGSAFENDERGDTKSLNLKIGKLSAIQAKNTGKFVYAQPFRDGALAHFERALEMKSPSDYGYEKIQKAIESLKSWASPV